MYNNDISQLKEVLESHDLYSPRQDRTGLTYRFTDDEMMFFEHCCPQSQVDEVTKLARNGKDGIYKAMKLGLLNCEPIIYNDNLVYGMDKWVHWFRGYHFQVSATEKGFGTMEHSYSRLDFIAEQARSFDEEAETSSETVVNFCLALAAMTTGLAYYSKTKAMLDSTSGRELFDAFLKKSSKRQPGATDSVSVSDVLKYVSIERSPYLIDADPKDEIAVALLGDDNKAYGLVYVSSKSVKVVSADTESYVYYVFSVPSWMHEKDIYGDYYIARIREFYEFFIEFLLKYAGYHANGVVLYPVNCKSNEKLEVPNHCRKSAKNLSELFDRLAEQ